MMNADITVFSNDKNLLVLLQSYCFAKGFRLIPLEFTINSIRMMAKYKPNAVILPDSLLRNPNKAFELSLLKREAINNKYLKICALHDNISPLATETLAWLDIVLAHPIDLVRLDNFLQTHFLPAIAERAERRVHDRRCGSDRRSVRLERIGKDFPFSVNQPGNGAGVPQNYSFHLDQRNRCLVVEGHKIELTPKEFELIDLLLTDVDRIFKPEEIVRHLWPESQRANKADLYQYMHLLRKKIERDPDHPKWLMNVKGHGYKLNLN